MQIKPFSRNVTITILQILCEFEWTSKVQPLMKQLSLTTHFCIVSPKNHVLNEILQFDSYFLRNNQMALHIKEMIALLEMILLGNF